MAGPLKNNRHELFVLALASGKSAAESYTAAGYKWNSGNCIRLKGNPRVRERLVELQQGAARSTEITISSICRELDEANQVARASGSASAMVSASTLRAKLAGLLTEKIKAEVEVSNVNKYEGKDTPKIAAMVAADLVDSFDNLSDADLVQLGLMLEEYAETVRQFIRSCRARSVSGYGGQRQIELARSPKGNGYKRIS
jgi:hypothetical protein